MPEPSVQILSSYKAFKPASFSPTPLHAAANASGEISDRPCTSFFKDSEATTNPKAAGVDRTSAIGVSCPAAERLSGLVWDVGGVVYR